MSEEKEMKDAGQESEEKTAKQFPEFPPLNEEKIASMTHEEKLKLIETEAQTLYDFCLEKGFSKKDLSWCLKPLFGSPPEYVKKIARDNFKFCFTLAITFGLIAFVVAWPPAYSYFCVQGKLALMKVLPYWDWTYLYDQDCLLKNPYVKAERNLTKEECQVCIDLGKNGIEGAANLSHENMANDFLLVDYPIVVEDGTKGWPKPEFDVESLAEEYQNHKDLDSVGDCRFNSSVPEATNIYEFFSTYQLNGLPKKYYAHWENCDLKAAKHFRLNYKRPYYLPPMAEAAKTNTFFISKGKFEDEVLPWANEEDASGLWITVVKGKLSVDLEPVDGCAAFKGCGTVSAELKKGESIVVPLRLWQVDVSPIDEKETIAIGSTMMWDENEGAEEDTVADQNTTKQKKNSDEGAEPKEKNEQKGDEEAESKENNDKEDESKEKDDKEAESKEKKDKEDESKEKDDKEVESKEKDDKEVESKE